MPSSTRGYAGIHRDTHVSKCIPAYPLMVHRDTFGYMCIPVYPCVSLCIPVYSLSHPKIDPCVYTKAVSFHTILHWREKYWAEQPPKYPTNSAQHEHSSTLFVDRHLFGTGFQNHQKQSQKTNFRNLFLSSASFNLAFVITMLKNFICFWTYLYLCYNFQITYQT